MVRTFLVALFWHRGGCHSPLECDLRAGRRAGRKCSCSNFSSASCLSGSASRRFSTQHLGRHRGTESLALRWSDVDFELWPTRRRISLFSEAPPWPSHEAHLRRRSIEFGRANDSKCRTPIQSSDNRGVRSHPGFAGVALYRALRSRLYIDKMRSPLSAKRVSPLGVTLICTTVKKYMKIYCQTIDCE